MEYRKRAIAHKKTGDLAQAKADFAQAKKLCGWGADDEEQAPEPRPPSKTPPAAQAMAKPSPKPDRRLFGPESLGLGPRDEIRLDFSSSGCFHHFSSALILAGSSPDSARLEGVTRPIPLNENDWRRLKTMFRRYHASSSVSSTTTDRIGIAWFSDHRWARYERVVDSSGKSDLLNKLIYRAMREDSPSADEQECVSVAYPVGDIVSHSDAQGNVTNDVAPLVGLIYELLAHDSWAPGKDCTIRVGPASEPPILTISQTSESHREIARLLGLLRQIRQDTAKDRPDVYFDDPKARQVWQMLSQQVSCDFDKAPLGKAIEQLRTRYHVDVRIAQNDSNVSPPEARAAHKALRPVTLRAENLSLRSALNLMLEPMGLSWTVEHGHLMITASSQGDSMLRAYPLDDLVSTTPGDNAVAPEAILDLVAENSGPLALLGDWTLGVFADNNRHFLVASMPAEGHEGVAQTLYRLPAHDRPARGDRLRNRARNPAV